MFNWSCYMSHAYREHPASPHVHWWAVPRCARPVEFAGRTYDDPHFGNPYDHERWFDAPLELRRRMVAAIQHHLPVTNGT
jgi:hypothetical protein